MTRQRERRTRIRPRHHRRERSTQQYPASTGDLSDIFYLDSGASYHFIPSRGDLHAYQKFATPVEIAATNGGTIYAYGSGTLQVATLVNGLERQVDLQDLYYAPQRHARLVSLGRLEEHG